FYSTYILLGAPYSVSLSDTLVNSFEAGDNRRVHWVGEITVGTMKYYFPYKYKARGNVPITEYTIALRLAEQYLIRAEARAKQNNISGANQDLNIIRNRAGLNSLDITDPSELWLAILQERKVELFCESDNRWADLRRMSLADQILGSIKAPNWQPSDKLYPIPITEMNRNPNLSQNPGY
ncbi:MAG TPA: RagB/SusD family nutrient uptake outer membrane protein, partial [Flavobacterium sp.]|nr:RagB/SusD family nutrient uptake outer membrane protein [Flavobacterium sp.]